MILFTFYWSYIFPSFFEEPRSRRTHIFDSSSMRQSYACCLMRNCLFPTENVLKKTLIVHNNVTTFLATACMHGLVVMCTLCMYHSTIFQACPTCVRTCRCVCVSRRLFSFPRIDALDLFNDLLTRVVFWFGSFFHISVLNS